LINYLVVILIYNTKVHNAYLTFPNPNAMWREFFHLIAIKAEIWISNETLQLIYSGKYASYLIY